MHYIAVRKSPPPHLSSYVPALLLNIQRKLNVSWCVHFFFGVFSSQGSCSENAGAGASARGEGAPPPLTNNNKQLTASERPREKKAGSPSLTPSQQRKLIIFSGSVRVCVCVRVVHSNFYVHTRDEVGEEEMVKEAAAAVKAGGRGPSRRRS